MRILLIDDDEKFRNDLQLWLTQKLRHSVAVAGSVHEAIAQLGQDRYKAILLDSHLRNSTDDQVDSNSKGGLETLEAMSTQDVSKTILVTKHYLDDLSAPALRGCNRFVYKRWRSLKTAEGSDEFHQKLMEHLGQLAAMRPDVLTTVLSGGAIFLVGTGVTWQLFKPFTPALLTALFGTMMSVVSFLAFLTGRPIHRLWRRQHP